MSQRLLGQAPRVSSLPQISGEDLSHLHAREASALSCISPRSMLDNRRDVYCNRATGIFGGTRTSGGCRHCSAPLWTVENPLRGGPNTVIVSYHSFDNDHACSREPCLNRRPKKKLTGSAVAANSSCWQTPLVGGAASMAQAASGLSSAT